MSAKSKNRRSGAGVRIHDGLVKILSGLSEQRLMTKRNRRRTGAKKSGKYSMTMEKVAQVQQWLNRMRIHLQKAVILSAKMDKTRLSEDDDLYWAFVKYAENVQECAVQLDNINDSIFPCLAELPMKSENEELSWDGLKGMRSRLAHKFWDISPTILWNTVTRDFPKLDDLLGSLMISNVVADLEEQPGVLIEAERFRKLPPVETEDAIHSGTSIPFLYFDSIGKAQALRIGRSADNIPMVAHSKTGTFKMRVAYIN